MGTIHSQGSDEDESSSDGSGEYDLNPDEIMVDQIGETDMYGAASSAEAISKLNSMYK